MSIRQTSAIVALGIILSASLTACGPAQPATSAEDDDQTPAATSAVPGAANAQKKVDDVNADTSEQQEQLGELEDENSD